MIQFIEIIINRYFEGIAVAPVYDQTPYPNSIPQSHIW